MASRASRRTGSDEKAGRSIYVTGRWVCCAYNRHARMIYSVMHTHTHMNTHSLSHTRLVLDMNLREGLRRLILYLIFGSKSVVFFYGRVLRLF